MTAPENVVQLVERFERNIDDYRSGKYNETQVRIEFVDPLFKALGWDVDNEQGHAERYKDVIHEDAVKIGGSTKAPDYSFRIGGVRKFFVETKKPSVNLKDDTAPAYQVRRYAWSAKLPVSILTDFEEFAVYDCRNRPAKTDNAATSRVMYLKYKDYINQWDMLYETYSREAVLKGAFDKFVEEFKTARGTQEVDTAFLAEIERWRDELARNLALRNEDLNQRQLNFAVQRTIDRIIFLRIAEDRGIEPYQQLGDITQAEDIYKNLMRLFQRADDRYNSGLFHFKEEKGRGGYPDYLTPALKLDNRVLKGILSNLYYPDSPYEFSVLPAEILGQVYEQFLGKVIRLTAGHQAKIEEKPEVKKAGGVYYTPAYIVEYIVKNTVGKLVEGKTPRQVNNIRILDPACGSGSFLLGAYQYLLDWHLENYLKSEVKSHKRRIYQVGEKDWQLTTEERKRILLNNIYGVDIDSQAVEVTKLSLLLKVLEGETQQQLELIPERVLPDLGNNIKCGNSLIGPDFYEGEQMGMFEMDSEERLRINAFDWDTEFIEIMRAGGFDAVIGNPPYIDSEWMTTYLPEARNYCSSKYKSASGNWDIFCVFIERALILSKTSGLSSMIVPNKLGSANYASCIREVLTLDNQLLSIRDFSKVPVFPVAVYPIIYLAKKDSPKSKGNVIYERVETLNRGNIGISVAQELDYQRFFSIPKFPWRIFSDLQEQNPTDRLVEQFPSLDSVANVLGAATVAEAYEIKPLISDYDTKEENLLKVINSGTIDRYHSLWGEKKFRYLKDSFLNPVIRKKQIAELPPKRKEQAFQKKIIVAGMTKVLECALDFDGEYLAGKSTSIITSNFDLRYLLGILNSNLITFVYKSIFSGNALQGGYLRIGPPQLRTIPIRTINFDDPGDKAQHEKMVSLVESMLSLHKQLAAAATTPHEQIALQRQIDATDKQIDRLVYELYGLTEEEIEIVEGSVGV